MKEEMNMDEFQKRAAELIRQGKPLTGEGGIFTPLIKQVLEASVCPGLKQPPVSLVLHFRPSFDGVPEVL